MRNFNFILIVLLLALNGCDTNRSTEVAKETGPPPTIIFCPPADCGKHLVALINSSEQSVHCAFYDLKLKEVISALSSKSHYADVKIVLEADRYKGQVRGPAVKLDNKSRNMHNKFCVIDNRVVWTGSFNPTTQAANNNNVVLLYSKYLAENYEEEFIELWSGQSRKAKHPIIYLNGRKIENYFCPEDDCALHIIDAINNAKSSIYFMVFSFTHDDIADAILFNENAEIRGIFEKSQAASKYSQYKRLSDFGLDVKLDKNKHLMHHKVFIIDNETVITGSFNPTESGDSRNKENLLIIHDKGVAEKYLQEFERRWGST
jgi:phosphatidylserine/phosphatidylglycerophosphate/cardiolipin synthase-like enzyme